MKKTLALILIITITMIMAIIVTGCKSRKLSKESTSIVDKTKTEQTSQVKERVTDSASHEEIKLSTLTDQSGTWVWEEWYQRDKDADTTISSIPRDLLYKRTTFVKTDITKTETSTVNSFENHSEIKDSTGTQTVQNGIKTESKKKGLDAVKESPTSWIWPMIGLALVLFALVFIIKSR